MGPEWLRALERPPDAHTHVGVALAVTDPDAGFLHTGLVYWEPGEPPRLLHLAFHAWLCDEELPSASVEYRWARLDLFDDAAAAVAGFCRRVAKRPPTVPYGIVYEGGSLADDGSALLGSRAVGLTCATYVLALLATFQHDLLELQTWFTHPEDEQWHANIVEALVAYRRRHPDRLSQAHVDRVRAERGCVRYRPEEVAAAASGPWPAPFAQVEEPGGQARAWLLARDERR